jgi:hypothetical protein
VKNIDFNGLIFNEIATDLLMQALLNLTYIQLVEKKKERKNT